VGSATYERTRIPKAKIPMFEQEWGGLRQVAALDAHGPVMCMAFSRDDSVIAFAEQSRSYTGGRVVLCNGATGERIWVI